jgi:hypothetical protein
MNYVENFSNGLTVETAKEIFVFIALFKSFESDIDLLKNKFEWYLEQWYQMDEQGNNDFFKHILNEINLQKDIKEMFDK